MFDPRDLQIRDIVACVAHAQTELEEARRLRGYGREYRAQVWERIISARSWRNQARSLVMPRTLA